METQLDKDTQMMIANQIICWEQIKYEDTRYLQYLPSVLYKPKLYIDGNQWCASYGDMPEGVFGFGDSPQKAIDDFNKNFNESLNKE